VHVLLYSKRIIYSFNILKYIVIRLFLWQSFLIVPIEASRYSCIEKMILPTIHFFLIYAMANVMTKQYEANKCYRLCNWYFYLHI
jgi:hypothetical protein